ncbi:MAG: HlyD family efflux transporter periplasmic adaptor subunit [Deltaproteobacteria bacterium]|nr:HlyD family efflux transporter periplasmic adaptor subunit [Deltaproteobacteria bacterium]
MTRKLIPVVVLAVLAGAGFVLWKTQRGGETHYTGFVEGEERVLRSEVSGRVLEVRYREGDSVPAGAAVARLDDADIVARIRSKQQELGVLDAQIGRQEQEIGLVERVWRQDLAARTAELRQAKAAYELARRTNDRQESLMGQGVTTAQRVDEARASRDQTRSAVDRAQDVLGRVRAEEAQIAVAKQQLEVLRQQRDLSRSQLGELEVQRAKFEIRAPSVPTVVQTQLLWPGELAQPGTPVLAVLDPRDKYVQIYVPVSDLDRLRVGQRVEIELDSEPGRRVPGEVSFLADQANFTPEKIETRSDRIGQVYRAKVRILRDVERFQPGTEGNVYLVAEGETPQPVSQGGR